MHADNATPPDIGGRRMAIGVLALCTAMNLLSRGVADTYAVFLLPLLREFDADRAALTGVYSVYMLVYGLAAPAAGIAFDRFGPRVLYCAGIACFGLSYVLAGSAGTLWQLYVLVGIGGGIGSVALGMVPASALVSRWFRRRLPSAMSILFAALGTGVLLFAPATQWLIEQIGWRTTYHLVGGAVLLLFPLMLMLPWPAIAAGHPDYDATAQTPATLPGRGVLARALRMPAFWGLFGVMFITSVTTFSVVVQIVAYLVEIGFAPLEAASIYGVMGMLSIAGLLGSGALAQRYGERRIATLSYSCTIAGIMMLGLLQWQPAFVLVAAFALLFGTVQGSRGPLVATLAARLFARSGLGAVYGCISLGMGVGAAIGSSAAGALHDLTGGYLAGFALATAGAVIGMLLFRFTDTLSTRPLAPTVDSRNPTVVP
jgi:MFS family permease